MPSDFELLDLRALLKGFNFIGKMLALFLFPPRQYDSFQMF